MNKITTIFSTAVPLPIENIDTDQIIPARFLKATTREGFGENLFRDWRYDKDGKLKGEFVLNNSVYSGEILIAGRNFGCGSSREHAAWALADYGFRVVVSSFFADIFKSNALNNYILPIQVSDTFLEKALKLIDKNPQSILNINLPKQTITVVGSDLHESFEISPYKKMCLINGFDDIGYLLNIQDKINTFERGRNRTFSNKRNL